jgi:hypothetical protein
VHLTDRFEFETAKTTLEEVVSARKGWLDVLAKQLGTTTDKLPAQELAECYGSLGHVNAFLGDREEAEKDFRQALEHFNKPRDRERQWVYLGHLACDHGPSEKGMSLWNEVAENLQVTLSQPVVRPGGQYLLALQLKGAIVFSDVSSLEQFSASILKTKFEDTFPSDELKQNPFGLIHQARGMLYQRALENQIPLPEGQDKSWLVLARDAYDQAINHMNDFGTELLEFLSWIANLRRARMVSTAGDTPTSRKRAAEKLSALLQSPPDIARKLQVAVDPDPNRQAALWIESVRFNYW